jgi:hypothetical protein
MWVRASMSPPVLRRPRQEFLDEPQPLDRDALGHRVEGRRAIGLEAMGEGVHPGRGRQVRRQPERQLGIEDHLRGQHPGMEDHLLHAEASQRR